MQKGGDKGGKRVREVKKQSKREREREMREKGKKKREEEMKGREMER